MVYVIEVYVTSGLYLILVRFGMRNFGKLWGIALIVGGMMPLNNLVYSLKVV
jgi:hypothetical protein